MADGDEVLGAVWGRLPPGVRRALARAPVLGRGVAWWQSQRVGTLRVGIGQGLKFRAGPSNPAYASGDSELPVQQTLARHVRPGHVVYDVGANVGFFSVLAARLVGPRGKVYAFEPVPDNATLAVENARRNDFGNVEVIGKAVDRASGRAQIALARYAGGSMLSTVGRPPDDTGTTLAVEAVSLDDFVFRDGAPPPDVVKVDVEGAELGVLEGMRRLLREHRPVVLYEVDDEDAAVARRKYDACARLLEDAGYEVAPLEDSYADSGWRVAHGLGLPRGRAAAREPAPPARGFLEQLRCPLCDTDLRLDGAAEDAIAYGVLRCACYRYPIVEGIPILRQLSSYGALADPIVERLDAGDRAGALEAALALASPVPPPRPAAEALAARADRVSPLVGRLARAAGKMVAAPAEGEAPTFAEAARRLRPGSYADYLVYRHANPSFLAATPLLATLASSLRAGRVIDLACGAGHASFLLRRLEPALDVVAVDHDFANLLLARRFHGRDITWICADTELPLPFADGAFAAALCLDGLHYVRSKAALARELARVVEPRGPCLFPHLHNRDAGNTNPGVPMDPEGYRRCLAALAPRVLVERHLLDGFARTGTLDLAEPPARELADAPVLTVVADRGAPLDVPPDLLEILWRRRELLGLNPVFRASAQGATVRLDRRWPTRELEAECAQAHLYLPASLELDAALADRIHARRLEESDRAAALPLLRSFVLVPLPAAYV
jgi:FkbM family methyltransferase